MRLSTSETGASHAYAALVKEAGSTAAPLSTKRRSDGSCSPAEMREKLREAQHRVAVVEALLRLGVLNISEVLRVMRSSGSGLWPVPGLEDPTRWDRPSCSVQVSCCATRRRPCNPNPPVTPIRSPHRTSQLKELLSAQSILAPRAASMPPAQRPPTTPLEGDSRIRESLGPAWSWPRRRSLFVDGSAGCPQRAADGVAARAGG